MTISELPRLPRADVDAIIDHYLTIAGEEVALSSVSALERSLRFIEDNPMAGSTRLGITYNKGALRIWPIKGFAHQIVYCLAGERITVARVLHSSRDIPAQLRDPG